MDLLEHLIINSFKYSSHLMHRFSQIASLCFGPSSLIQMLLNNEMMFGPQLIACNVVPLQHIVTMSMWILVL